MEWRMFEFGPQGRSIYVDENNRLIMNADPSASGYIYGYGPKGRPLMVDASGALLVNVSGISGGGTGDVTQADLIETSGHLQDQIDALNSLDWQESVITQTSGSPPPSPTTGDRYIVNGSGTGAWAGQGDNIAEWDGAAWDFTTANEGMAAWVEDEDTAYVFNTSWMPFGSVITHNNLQGLQGGATSEYYHLTDAQHSILTTQSGIFYRKDEDLIPSADSTYDIGEEATKFNDLHTVSGHFKGVYINAENGTQPALEIDSYSNVAIFDISNSGEAIALDLEKLATGASPVIRIANSGTGYDIEGTSDLWWINPEGTIFAQSGRFTNGLQIGGSTLHLRPDGSLSDETYSVTVEEMANVIGVSGDFYKKNANVEPDTDDIYTLGTASKGFSDAYASNLHATSGNLNTLALSAASGESFPVIGITNAGDGNDITGNSDNWSVDSLGNAVFASGAFDNLTIGGKPVGGNVTATISSWTWDAGEGLYWANVSHNLGNRLVIVQYYNPSTFDSVEVDHHVLTDTNTIKVWSSTNDNVGVIIRG